MNCYSAVSSPLTPLSCGCSSQLLSKPKFSGVEKIKTIGSTYMAATGLNASPGADGTQVSRACFTRYISWIPTPCHSCGFLPVLPGGGVEKRIIDTVLFFNVLCLQTSTNRPNAHKCQGHICPYGESRAPLLWLRVMK